MTASALRLSFDLPVSALAPRPVTTGEALPLLRFARDDWRGDRLDWLEARDPAEPFRDALAACAEGTWLAELVSRLRLLGRLTEHEEALCAVAAVRLILPVVEEPDRAAIAGHLDVVERWASGRDHSTAILNTWWEIDLAEMRWLGVRADSPTGRAYSIADHAARSRAWPAAHAVVRFRRDLSRGDIEQQTADAIRAALPVERLAEALRAPLVCPLCRAGLKRFVGPHGAYYRCERHPACDGLLGRLSA